MWTPRLSAAYVALLVACLPAASAFQIRPLPMPSVPLTADMVPLRGHVRPLPARRSIGALFSLSMGAAKPGDKVSIHYVGTLDDGSQFDSSRKRNTPFEFTLGMGEVVPGFEKAVLGMSVGEKKTSKFGPEDGYGQPREDMIITLQPGTLPPGAKLDLGTEVQLPTGQVARVVEVGEDGSFKIDANHRLAGKALCFEVELLDCIEPKLVSDSGFSLEKMPLEQQIMEAKAAELPKMSMNVIFNHGTEPPFSGKTVDGTSHDCKDPGTWVCAVGGLPLFSTEHKFESGTGWPSFYQPIDPDHIIERKDVSAGMVRIEVLCARTGAHLGHVFPDGPAPTNKRYCINAAALKFVPEGTPIE